MSYFNIILDRSREKLTEIPEDVLQMTNLKMLYLEGNLLEYLPPFFFEQLPHLTWLDLRSNCLKEIPPSIGLHENLENLLLNDNRLNTLPNELGLLPKLKVLQIAHNPLVYPPAHIIDEGTKAIMDFLNKQYRTERKIIPYDEKEINSIEAFSSEGSKLNLPHDMKKSLYVVPSAPNLYSVDGKKSFSNVNHQTSRSRSKISVRSSCHTHLVTKEKVEMSQLKEEFLIKVKEMLMEQEKILQQEKNLKTLEGWRKDKKSESVIKTKELQPPPFAIYPEYNKMPSREDLFKQIDKYIERSRKVPTVDIDKVINDLVSQLRNLKPTEINNGETDINNMTKEINAILNIHKKLLALQGKNQIH